MSRKRTKLDIGTAADTARSKNPEPPVAERRPVVSTEHGLTRIDDYAWLRAENWQEVMRDPSQLPAEIRTYLEAENAYTESITTDTETLRRDLFAEMRGRIKEDDSTVPAPDGHYAYAVRFTEGAEYPAIVRSDRNGGGEKVLLDGNLLAADHTYFRLGGSMHSPDHSLLAYAYDDKGSEYFTLRLRDTESMEDRVDVIPATAGNMAWAEDGNSLFYVWVDDNHRPAKLFRHVIDGDPVDDILVYAEADPGFFLSVGKTHSNRYILVDSQDHETSEVRLLDSLDPTTAPVLIGERKKGEEYHVEHGGDRLYILTNTDGAEDFKIVTAPATAPGRENWQDLVAHRDGRLIIGHVVFKDFLVYLEREDGLPRIIIHRLADGEEHAVAFDEEAYSLGIAGSYEFDTTTLRFTYSSLTTPSRVYDYDMVARTRVLRKEDEIPSGHDPNDYVTRRVLAPAGDGEMVPISLLYRRETAIDGTASCLLYGYGAYGISIPAAFSVSRLSLADRGFVYAIAHVRGGKEKGYHWYADGRRENKANTFTDFIAAADYLAGHGFAAPGRIVGWGASAGGMLIGAVANMAPDRFAALIAEVPFVDVLNTMLDDTLPLTPPEWMEWGNPIADPDAYRKIASYSPYDNVAAQDYPAILALAGLTDPRVTYWEPAKWVAKLRATKTDSRPLLLRTNMEAGHGGAAGRFDRLRETAFAIAFALKMVGRA